MNGRVKEIRKTLNLSQREFGKRLGVQDTAISKLESGERNLTDQMLLAVCREYSVNEDWLRTGNGQMFVQNEQTELARLAHDYMLDALDCKIIESYMRLSKFQRQAIKRFIMDVAEQESASSDETAHIFRVAESEDNTPPQILDVPQSRIDKLKSAKGVKSDNEI